MLTRRDLGKLVANRMYGEGAGSHVICNLLKGVGIPISTKSIIKNAQFAGLSVKSKWARRIGRAKDSAWGKPLWKTINSGHVPLNMAQTLASWLHYYDLYGIFNLDAIAKEEKPP